MLTLTDCGRVAGDQLRMRAQMTTDANKVGAAVLQEDFACLAFYLPESLYRILIKL